MNRITRTLADTTAKVLTRTTEITAVVDHGAHFRSIELTGDALRKASWTLGDKVQVRVEAGGLMMRTYTPIGWDAAAGSTRLLAYAHEAGPGSTWITAATPGQRCQLFGPRASLKLSDLAGPTIFVGDETSFALAAAWYSTRPDEQPVSALFEVNDPDESAVVLNTIGVATGPLVRRRDGSTHLGELADATVDALRAHPGASLCITGKAQTIAQLRQTLKFAELAQRPTRVKAYWDENRKGLD